MNLFINQESVNVEAPLTLQQLAINRCWIDLKVAIAVNRQVIARQAWATTELKDNDSLTVITLSKGG